jgi:hypothetical protein
MPWVVSADSLGDFMNILSFPHVRKSEKLTRVSTGASGLLHIDDVSEIVPEGVVAIRVGHWWWSTDGIDEGLSMSSIQLRIIGSDNRDSRGVMLEGFGDFSKDWVVVGLQRHEIGCLNIREFDFVESNAQVTRGCTLATNPFILVASIASVWWGLVSSLTTTTTLKVTPSKASLVSKAALVVPARKRTVRGEIFMIV